MTITATFHLDSAQRDLQKRLQHLAERVNAGHSVEHGLYIWGPVGRGKTHLVNNFCTQVNSNRVQRLHFHYFMQRVHESLNRLNGQADPLRLVAAEWAGSDLRVLCLDEFMVEDIGDAMLLGNLWRYFFELDIVLVATSNTAPADLYYNGLQRDRFLPAIRLLENNCEIFYLDGGKDYRLTSASDMPYFFIRKDATFLRRATEKYFGKVMPIPAVTVLGRSIPALWDNSAVIGFDFMALCSGPRSQYDYMELAHRYKAIAVANVPAFSYIAENDTVLGTEESYQRPTNVIRHSKLDNEARRFIALLDECYERKCLLIITAEAMPHELYQGEQLAMAFQRCSSRLFEMQRW